MRLTKKRLDGLNVLLSKTHFGTGHYLLERSSIDNPAALESAEMMLEVYGCCMEALSQAKISNVLKLYKKSKLELTLTNLRLVYGDKLIAVYRSSRGNHVAFVDSEFLDACGWPQVVRCKDATGPLFFSNGKEVVMPMRWELPDWMQRDMPDWVQPI